MKFSYSQNSPRQQINTIVKAGEDYKNKALKNYADKKFEAFYQYCDSASNSFLEEKKLPQWLYSNILAIEHLNRTKQFERAYKWAKRIENDGWPAKTKNEFLHYGSFYMQKGFSELRCGEYPKSIETYNEAIDYYQRACKDEKVKNPYCINDTNAGLYLLMPQNESRLKLSQVDEVINALSDNFLNHLRNSLKTANNYDPLAKLYHQKSEAYIKKQDTINAHKFNKLRYELPKLGFEELIRANVDYGNTLHLLEKESQKAKEILNRQLNKIDSSSLSKNKKRMFLSQTYLFYAYVVRDSGSLDLAFDKASQSLALRKEIYQSPLHPVLIKNYWLLGDLWSRKKNYKKSRTYHRLAIQCLISKASNLAKLFSLKQNELIPNFQLGQLFKAMGDSYSDEYNSTNNTIFLDSSLICFKRMVQTEDLLKSSHVLESSRLYVSKRRNRYLTVALEACYKLYKEKGNEIYLQEALYFMEKSRAQELELALKQAEVIKTLNLEQKVLALNTARLKWEEKRMDLELSDSTDAQEQILVNKLSSEYINLKQAFDDTLKSLDPAYHTWLINREPASFQEIRGSLSRRSALMSFFESEEAIYLLSFSKNKADFQKISFANGNFSQIDSLRAFLRNNYPSNIQKKAYEASAFMLYQELFSHLDSWSVKELICISPSIFHDIPFEVLLTEDKTQEEIGYRSLPYLWRKYQIRYQYAAQAEVTKQDPAISSRPTFTYIGFAPDYSEYIASVSKNTQARRSVRELTHNVDEVRISDTIISSNKNSRVFVKDSASASMFKQYAARANVLHLAMHASAEKDSLPKLLFGNSELSVNQIYSLSLASDLTILSACQTGLGEEIKGEGIMSLGRAFMYAGSKSVIESLWNVDDQSSQKFVPLFMKGIKSDLSKAEALNKARSEYLNSETNKNINMPPYYWSQFVLYGGNVEASTIGSPGKIVMALFFVILLLIGGVVLYRNKRLKNELI